MVTKDKLKKELGISIRDDIRTDSVILAFNSEEDAENWIFLGRPKDKDKKFPVPRIIVESIDQSREDYSAGGKKEINLSYLFHAWLDQDIASAYDPYEVEDRLAKIGEELEDLDNGIKNSEVVSSSSDPEVEDNRTLIHTVVRVAVVWRE